MVHGDFVTTEDGTGLVHIAPAFGAEDMQAAMEYDLPMLMTVAEDGTFIPEVRPGAGSLSRTPIRSSSRIYRRAACFSGPRAYTHTYPFCWRCNTPLLYYARSTWYIRTTQYKEKLVELEPTHQLGSRAYPGWTLWQLAGE